MGRRGPYRKYSNENRLRIVSAYEDGEDWRSVATLLNVNIRSALGWIRDAESGKPRRKHGGHMKKKLTEEQIDSMVEWLSDDPTMTLNIMKMRVTAEFEVDLCLSTISSYLNCRLLTIKKLHLVSETMNSFENKRKRKIYVEKLENYRQAGMRLVWMDETNINLHCTRNQGWSIRGTRARVAVTSSRGANLHIIGAIDETGFLDYTVKRGSFNKITFQQWLRRLLDKLRACSNQTNVIICDNAPCHSDAEAVFQEPQYVEQKLLRLGPYSPALNPIEGIWSILKSKIKAQMRLGYNDMLQGDLTNNLTKQEYRMRFLENIATEAKNVVLPQHCRNMVKHVTEHFKDVLLLKDL